MLYVNVVKSLDPETENLFIKMVVQLKKREELKERRQAMLKLIMLESEGRWPRICN
jgi:hypothetical protein